MTAVALAPGESSGPGRARDALLAVAVVLFWWIRFGPLGPQFDADVAVMGAMALRPLSFESIYFWGQDRLGALNPLLARVPVHVFGADAGATAQALTYLAAGATLWAFLRLLRTWPWKLALTALWAFPAGELAIYVLNPGQPYPVGGMFASLQLLAFLRAHRNASGPNIALAAGLAGFTLWAGEVCAVFLPVEAAVLLVELVRANRGGRSREIASAIGHAILGLLPAALVVVVGKHFSFRPREYYQLVPLREAFHNLIGLTPSFRDLAPLFGGAFYVLVALLAALAALQFWQWVRGSSSELTPLMFLGLAPFLTLAGVSASMWYLVNAHESRYFDFGILVALVALCGTMETLSLRWSGLLGRVLAMSAALALVVFWVIAAAPGQPAAIRFFQSGGVTFHRTSGQQWREKTALALEAGCLGLIGDYWQSYPYLTLSQGIILATPHEKAYVRSKSLARDAVQQPVVCVVPWEAPLDECPADLTQFGASLTLRDRYEGKVGGEAVDFCRYRSSLAP